MGLENINGFEIILIVLVALFIFGPDRLPKAIADGMRMIRQLRTMARTATSDLSRELGTDVKLEDLHPKTFLRKHLLSEEEEKALRKPIEDVYGDLRGVADTVNSDIGAAADSSPSATVTRQPAAHEDTTRETVGRASGRSHQYDDDAT